MENARLFPHFSHAARIGLARLFENADESERRNPRFTIETQQ
jgi:hypothetical protein